MRLWAVNLTGGVWLSLLTALSPSLLVKSDGRLDWLRGCAMRCVCCETGRDLVTYAGAAKEKIVKRLA